MNNYRGSKKRLVLLLTNFAMLMYTFSSGNVKYPIFGYFLLLVLFFSMYDYWRNVE